MNKEEIISKLREYNFDKNEYIVITTAAMTLHGIKDKANDIDLAVSPKLYKEITSKYKGTYKESRVYTFDCFDIETENFDDEKIFIGDIPTQTIPEILKFKQSLNREKDIVDIKLIINYLININNELKIRKIEN